MLFLFPQISRLGWKETKLKQSTRSSVIEADPIEEVWSFVHKVSLHQIEEGWSFAQKILIRQRARFSVA